MRGHRGFFGRLFLAAMVAGSTGAVAPAVTHAQASTLTATTTTVTITSSANPSGYGQLLILSATVIQAIGTATPDGSVTFTDGPTSLGTVSLDSLGQAALSESALNAGTHSIVATYSGSAAFDPSISGTLSQVITAQGSTTMIISSLNPAAFGRTVVFIVNVLANGGTGIPTGNVTLSDGTAGIATATLSTSGTAVVGTSGLSVGNHAINADYLGDSNFTASSGGGLTETITRAATSVGLGSSANPSILGGPVTFTATVTPASGTGPTGIVTFADGTTTLGTAGLDGQGAATLTTSSLLPGNHSITATYAGNGNFSGSSAPPLNQAVNLPPTSTSLGSSANPAEFATPVTLTAVVTALNATPTGSVAFSDGTSALGSAALDAGGRASITLTTLSVGTHALGAAYNGDAGVAPSVATPLNQVITTAHSQLMITSSANPATFGSPVTLTGTLSTNHSGVGGVITFLDGSNSVGTGAIDVSGRAVLSLSTLSVGQHTLTAAYGGDADTASAASAPLTETVLTAPSGTALNSSSNPALVGQPITFTATVTAGAAPPTGSVAFNDGSTSLGTIGITTAGGATLTTSALAAGTHIITATYSGDVNLAPSSASLSQMIALIPTTTGLTSSSNPATVTDPVTLTATVTATSGGLPAGLVTFSDGGTSLGSASLGPDGHASLTTSALDLGIHHISAGYAGDGVRFAGSSSAAVDQTIIPITTRTTLSASADPVTIGVPVTFVATTSGATGAVPAGLVTFMDGSAALASVAVTADGTATFSTAGLGAGGHAMTAAFTGSSPFGNSVSAVLTETVLPAASTVALTSSANPSGLGSPITLTATVSTASGGLPGGTLTFFDGSAPLGSAAMSGGAASMVTSALSGGSHPLTAAYSGDTNHSPATSPVLDQTVIAAATTTVLTVTPNPARTGAPVLLSATVASGAGEPSGSVTFLNGTTSLGSVTLSQGVAEMTTTKLTKGAHALTAMYTGITDFQSSRSATITLTVRGGDDESCGRDGGSAGGDDDRSLYHGAAAWARHRRQHHGEDCQPGDSSVVQVTGSDSASPRGRDGGRRD